MGEYRGFFQKFNEDISLILKEFSQSKILKSEDVKKLKYELESKNEIFKELEIFITNIIVNLKKFSNF